MKKLLLLSLISASISAVQAQDSLYSKVLYNTNGYKGLAIKVDANANVAQVGLANYSNASFSLLDSLGNVLNASQYAVDGQPFSNFEFHDLAVLSDGNYLAVGTVMLQSFGVNVGVVAKLSSTGTVIWSKGVYPQAPVFFACNAVIESSENSYWIAGSDEQSGEMVIAELDTDGTTLQVNSFKNSGIRYKVEDILEYDSNTIVFSGYTLDNGGTSQGLVFATDNTGMLLWNNLLPNNKFYDLGADNSSIRIASVSSDAKLGIASLSSSGTFTSIQNTSFGGNQENVSMTKIKDSTYAVACNFNFSSDVDVIEIGNTLANRSSIMGMVTDVTSREHKGIYINAHGPIYGIKSSNWFAVPHGNLIRTDSLLTITDCGWGESQILETITAITDQTMTFTAITNASLMDLLINQSTNDLNDSISCVDFYSGIGENGENFLNIYPNPANSEINIQFVSKSSGILTLMDAQGKVVLTVEIDEINTIANITSLTNGLYFYSFVNRENQQVANGKLIKE